MHINILNKDLFLLHFLTEPYLTFYACFPIMSIFNFRTNLLETIQRWRWPEDIWFPFFATLQAGYHQICFSMFVSWFWPILWHQISRMSRMFSFCEFYLAEIMHLNVLNFYENLFLLHLLIGPCRAFYVCFPIMSMFHFRTNLLEVQMTWGYLVSLFLWFLQAGYHQISFFMLTWECLIFHVLQADYHPSSLHDLFVFISWFWPVLCHLGSRRCLRREFLCFNN